MNIEPYIELDKNLLLKINGSDSLFWDGFMWTATTTYIWIPLGVILLYIIFKNNSLKETLLTIISISLVIALADQISSGICKPLFQRFRPTQEADLMYLIDIVNNYRGGRYGFISSHAANSFGIAIFLSLLIRYKLLSVIMFSWATLNAYTRMYLGVHYPGDILFGTITGLICGYLVYSVYKWIKNKYFHSHPYVSSEYTSSGYRINDIKLFCISFVIIIFLTIIIGMLQIHLINL